MADHTTPQPPATSPRRGRRPGPLPRGICPGCGQNRALRKNGAMAAHNRLSRQGHSLGLCPGVDHHPGEQVTEPAAARPPAPQPTCRTYDVDGQPVVVHGDKPLNAEDQAALAELVRAAQKLADQRHPHAGVLQELHAAVRLAAACIPDGTVQAGPFGPRDGREVRDRLRAAARQVQEAVDAAEPDRKPRGTCTGCGQDFALRADGNIGQHLSRDPGQHHMDQCAGVGRPPRSA